jgi:hypothetical protein
MFDDKENLIGVALLALCVAIGGVMLWSIVTGQELVYNGPRWLSVALGVLFFGAIAYGIVKNVRGRRESGGAPQWPDPSSGGPPWWMFWKKR